MPDLTVTLTDDQQGALRELLALVHYDDLARSWLDLLPRELTARTPVVPDPTHSAAGLYRSGRDGFICIVPDGAHRDIYHGGRPVPGGTS